MDGVTPIFAVCGKCCLGIGTEGYWSEEQGKVNVERTLVTCFPDINISGWGWCTELNGWTADQVQGYLDSIVGVRG